MTTQIKDLKYYLNLDYDIKVDRIEDEDDYMYKAYTKDLDSKAFYGVGASKSEAVESFEETRIELFEYYFENKISIKEPTRVDDSLPSGKFIVRISPILHKKLIMLSERNSKSLNAFIDNILNIYCATNEFTTYFFKTTEKKLEKMINKCETNINYRFGNLNDESESYVIPKKYSKTG